MTKYKIKDFFGIITFAIINIAISYACTTALDIRNIVLFKTYTAMQCDITFEIIIFFALSFVECLIYHYKYEIKR